MKFKILTYEGYTAIADNELFEKDGTYSEVSMTKQQICDMMNKNELYKKQIAKALDYIDSWDMDYSINEITEILEETL